MDGDMSHDQMGTNFLDSAFFENFAGPSPSPLREASEDTETPNETTASLNPAPVPDVPSNVPEPPQNDSRTWQQPPRPLQPQSQPQPQPVPNNTNGTFTMPSPFNYQLQHPKRYIIITIIMCIITFIIIITIPEEEINGGSWSSNVKQTLCSQFNNKTKMVHRMQDDCIKAWGFNIPQPLKTRQHQIRVLHMLSTSYSNRLEY
ncbi:myb-like DNA-binding protein bas1 [Fusarium irregulare]|uniref:Myb-like DNA-binding protein bas1 n=1 Tax=Fusarium irregulare TaxID=2494466 RepID=A0A9W8U8V8_9HYPO|nr:myb-like DNA-binding protein bas1 [Fusarium irregulare]